MGSFGNVIRDARRGKFSQEQLCRNVSDALRSEGHRELTQSRLSDLERGKSVPNPKGEDDSALLRHLANVLGLSVESLFKRCDTDTRGRTATVMTRDEYFSETQAYLEHLQGRASLWFIGPRTIPVTESPEVKEIWARNLNAGISYHVVWFLDAIRASDLRRLVYELDEVGRMATQMATDETECADIIHHAVHISRPSAREADAVHFYEKMGATIPVVDRSPDSGSDAPTRNKFTTMKCLDRDFSPEERLLFLTYWQTFGSIVLLRPFAAKSRPLASLAVPNTLSSRSSQPQDIFVFFDLDRALELLRIAESLESAATDNGDEDA